MQEKKFLILCKIVELFTKWMKGEGSNYFEKEKKITVEIICSMFFNVVLMFP